MIKNIKDKKEKILYLRQRYVKDVDMWYKRERLINPVSSEGQKIVNKYNKILKNYFNGVK